MTSDQKQSWMTIMLLAVAQRLVALVLTASCLITIAPFTTAFSTATGTMACCTGKTDHDGGSCPSGLFGSSNKHHEASSHSEGPTDSVFEVSAGIHAQPSEPSSQAQAHDHVRQDAGRVTVASIARDCAGECGACSTSFNRQPRPREQSTLATKARPRLQTSSRLCDDVDSLCNTLQSVTTQLRPRAPPPGLSTLEKTEASW